MVAMTKIRELAQSIGREFNPEKVILFGSYACGKPSLNSDVDLLVVMNYRGKSVWKTIQILDRLKPVFPVDVLVRSSKQIQKRIRLGDFFLREVLEKGIVIYERAHS